MYNKITLFLLLSFCTTAVSAQDTTKKDIRWPLWSIEAGYHYQQTSAAELGINFTWYIYGMDDLCEAGVSFSGEYHFAGSRSFWAPKIGLVMDNSFYKLKGWGYTAKVNALWMDPGGYNDLRFLPQAGITWANIFHVYYGYQLPLSGERIPGLGTHRISVTFSIGYVRSIINLIDMSGGM